MFTDWVKVCKVQGGFSNVLDVTNKGIRYVDKMVSRWRKVQPSQSSSDTKRCTGIIRIRRDAEGESKRLIGADNQLT